ncbi:MAG: SRPBCC family protein [Chitinophagales bacterium]|nr:SRPBCC family protein [Chitinophagales bacterium]
MWGNVLIVLAGLFSLIVIAGFFLPSKVSFSRTLSLDADKKKVFEFINDLKKWRQWTAWSKENDARIALTYEGKEKGVGAVKRWKGKKMGAGRMEIIKSEPYKNVVVEIIFISGMRFESNFQLVSEETVTHVTWNMHGRVRRFGIAKIIGLLLPGWMGKDMQTGLKILKMISENKEPH